LANALETNPWRSKTALTWRYFRQVEDLPRISMAQPQVKGFVSANLILWHENSSCDFVDPSFAESTSDPRNHIYEAGFEVKSF
jgi:hypothetical protein